MYMTVLCCVEFYRWSSFNFPAFFCACVVMHVNDSNSTNKKGKKKKRTKERKKNQIKLPGNEAYNFFFIDCFEQMAVYSVF